MLIEKDFLWFLTTQLVPDENKHQPGTKQTAPLSLYEIEKMQCI